MSFRSELDRAVREERSRNTPLDDIAAILRGLAAEIEDKAKRERQGEWV